MFECLSDPVERDTDGDHHPDGPERRVGSDPRDDDSRPEGSGTGWTDPATLLSVTVVAGAALVAVGGVGWWVASRLR
jgi:hypothetical protein